MPEGYRHDIQHRNQLLRRVGLWFSSLPGRLTANSFLVFVFFRNGQLRNCHLANGCKWKAHMWTIGLEGEGGSPNLTTYTGVQPGLAWGSEGQTFLCKQMIAKVGKHQQELSSWEPQATWGSSNPNSSISICLPQKGSASSLAGSCVWQPP